ncbi:hypothetical protein [Gemmatimonas sp.]|jgi:hypothetical protein|uniref:hypothetical protein n=1 Tax=Gemmatimonas sp. TaxID=1962908 RepID=UPI0037C0DFFE
MRRLRWITVVLLGAAALGPLSTPASAQLGRLKKMGADAIKDAAKTKAGLAEPSANSSAKKANTTITPERLDLVLTSLQPLVATAELTLAAVTPRAAYEAKRKAAEECVSAAQKSVSPAAMMSMDEKSIARLEGMQKQGEAMEKRVQAAMARKDAKAVIALRDSIQVLSATTQVIAMGGRCAYPHQPPELIALEASIRGQAYVDGSEQPWLNGQNAKPLEPTPEARKAMTREEFGLLRERMALWAMAQSDPELKKALEGKFTAEEIAALTAKSAELGRLGPLFKGGALGWVAWGDVSEW